jgi:hypothetical protein
MLNLSTSSSILGISSEMRNGFEMTPSYKTDGEVRTRGHRHW